MAKEGLRLYSLKAAYKQTLDAGATPHREPDFDYLRENAVDGIATEVRGSVVFLEECNTGYDGDLERWLFTVAAKPGTNGNEASNKIRFMADLLPGLISHDAE